MFWGIDRGDFKLFGIRRLATLELDGLLAAPRGVPWTRQISLLDYAAWRARDGFVLALLKAGADFADGAVSCRARTALPLAYAVWTARAAARMRQLAVHFGQDAPCSCGAAGTLCFSPCHHRCCATCAWTGFNAADGDERRPTLQCPICGLTYRDPFVNANGSKFSGKVLPACEVGEGAWECQLCFYSSRGTRHHCRNCGTPAAAEGVAPPAPSSTCFQGLAAWIRARLPTCMALEWRARLQRRQQSLERWRALPSNEDAPRTRAERGKHVFRALSAEEDARVSLGLGQGSRSNSLFHGVQRGDAQRVAAVLEAGADVEVRNEYGQTPLHLASWRGSVEVVSTLLHWGADATVQCNGGASATSAALAAGHSAVLELLYASGALPAQPAPKFVAPPRPVVTKIPLTTPAGKFAYFVDGAFSPEFLDELEAVWRSLPVIDQDAEKARSDFIAKQYTDRSKQEAAPNRNYFCDVQGWVCENLEMAMRHPDAEGACTKAFAHFRFLHYAQAGGYLAAHIDIGRTDAAGRRSSHTMLLYLAEVEEGDGGETVLLESLEPGADAVYKVQPRRGRIVVYPHDTPHRAEPINAPPKLLLRGEMC